jgi:NADPH:quinone reductase-like Zn-dependent oxidoreductase
MKAIIWTKYGAPNVLQLREIDKPTPKDDELLVKVHATTVTAGDCEVRKLQFPIWLRLPMRLYIGFNRPKRITIPGSEFAGEVEAVGKDVTRFKVGDRVFGTTGFRFGTYAEYTCVPLQSDDGLIATIPADVSYDDAVAVTFGGNDALHFLRHGDLQRGQSILINGAGGTIGTFGVQLAKLMGAEVTAVDSAEKLDMLREIGADHVIDYQREDFTKNGELYDVIFDVVGKSPYARSLNSLKPKGRYLLANPRMPQMLRALWTNRTSDKQVIFEFAGRNDEDMQHLKELVAAGKLKAVNDRTYPLAQMVDAHEYVETGRKAGNVIITVEHET